MTIPEPQSLEKKENQYKSSQAHIPTCWSLLWDVVYGSNFLVDLVLKEPCKAVLAELLDELPGMPGGTPEEG